MKLQAVIFDLDGTLYNKNLLPTRLIISQLAKGKLSYLKQERKVRKLLKGQHFLSKSEFYDTFFKVFNKKNAEDWYFNDYLPDMVDILKKHYKIESWVISKFQYLKKNGIKTVVFSDYEFAKEKLTALGFDLTLADYIVSAPELGGLKPCKESFEKLCQIINVMPEDCLMIGDREDTDGDGARATNMQWKNIKNGLI